MKKIVAMASIAMLWTSGAWALGTEADTDISNTVTLSYSVGNVGQDDITSNADVFEVDKKIDMLLVTTDHDQQPVDPSDTDKTTNYTLTNEGNADQWFKFNIKNLTTADPNNGEADYDADVDTKQVNNLEVSCDNGANWYASGNLVIQVPHAAGSNTITCQVRADIPDAPGVGNGDIMNIELEAVAVTDNTGNTDDTETGGAGDVDRQGTVDVVWADGAVANDTGNTLGDKTGPGAGAKGDNNLDGKEVARSGYIVESPVLSIAKTSCVKSDPVNGTGAKRKRIPGAIIRYMFDIQNQGAADATNITLTDTIKSELDITDTVASARKVESQNADCDCASPGATDINGDTSIAGTPKKVTIQNINVAADPDGAGAQVSRSCVSIEVEIK